MKPPPKIDEREQSLFLDQIYREFHYDFREYSRPSMARRLSRAMGSMRCDSLSDLRLTLASDRRHFAQLLQYLTVQVSDLFRDPDYYRALREQIVPMLATYPSLRVWVAGCSTGEEFYSLAILLREEGLFDRTTFYCSDINPDAVRAAERGVYPVDRAAAFSENHRRSGATSSLSAHYTAAYGSIVFDRALRKRAVFCDHSLATDAVFAEVQLVSCRNVLIYFEQTLKDRALRLFADSLCRRGFLGLGQRECLRPHGGAAHFETFDGPNRWYQRP